MKAIIKAAAIVLLAILVFWPKAPSAVPTFARKYVTNCMMCHSVYPRLNDFGARFRQNGYRLPGLEEREQTVFESPPPFAARASVGFNFERQSGSSDQDMNRVQVGGLDLISAGLFAKNVGYMVIYPPPVPESAASEGQPGNIEMANVVISDVFVPQLQVRAGRFEPAYVAFSVKRRLSVAPYEVYEFAPRGLYSMAETQDGVELTASGFGGMALALGILDGAETNELDDPPTDLYLRAAKVFGAGEGQTAGQRIGVTGHFGMARPDPSLQLDGEREAFYRLGLDASLNLGQANLALQGLWGRDNAAFWAMEDDIDVFGGFAELTYSPMMHWLLLARYDAVFTPTDLGVGNIMRGTGAVRYLFVDNLALQGEYSYRTQEARPTGGDALVGHHATLRLDWAF